MSNLLVIFMLITMLGCSSTPQKESTGEYFDDTLITTKVKTAIFNEPSLNSAENNIETFKGVVQLSGFVSSLADANKATEIAPQCPRCKVSQNDMRVK